MEKKFCCFIGHRKIIETEDLKIRLYSLLEELVLKKEVETFLFGSKSQFNDLCYECVSELKLRFPYIKRIYVRAHFPFIDKDYEDYLLQSYEYTYYPDSTHNAGKLSYIKRNQNMIDKSAFCIFYYNKNYLPEISKTKNHLPEHHSKSGTKIAFEYAIKKHKTIINLLD